MPDDSTAVADPSVAPWQSGISDNSTAVAEPSAVVAWPCSRGTASWDNRGTASWDHHSWASWSQGWNDGNHLRDTWDQPNRSRGTGYWEPLSRPYQSLTYSDTEQQEPAGQGHPGGKGEGGWQSSFTDDRIFDHSAVAGSPLQDQPSRPCLAIQENHLSVAGPPAPFLTTAAPLTQIVPVERFGLDYFTRYADFTGTYKQHNAALKWFRQFCENSGRTEYVFNNTAVAEVPVINHPPGMGFSFDDVNNTTPWRWQEMVAQLDYGSIRDIICRNELFDPRQQHGAVFIQCKIQQTGKYSHKRAVAAKSGGIPENVPKKEKPTVWDFVLTRDDGHLVVLHPNWANTKVECKFGLPDTDDEVPAAGPGGSDGRGTYKYYKNKYVTTTLKFDAGKIPNNGKGKGCREGNKGKGEGKNEGKGNNEGKGKTGGNRG
jgi:hypothetical protein